MEQGGSRNAQIHSMSTTVPVDFAKVQKLAVDTVKFLETAEDDMDTKIAVLGNLTLSGSPQETLKEIVKVLANLGDSRSALKLADHVQKCLHATPLTGYRVRHELCLMYDELVATGQLEMLAID